MTATFAPAAASVRAQAAPRPEAPPVTIAACPFTSMSVRLLCVWIFDQQRDALTAADAGRRDTIAQVAALELARKRQRKADAGRAERMADGDGTAVDVELFLVEAEFARAG